MTAAQFSDLRPAEVGLDPVDRPQIKALCEAGYLPVSRYVELVTALGWDLVVEETPEPPKSPLPRMVHQIPWPIVSVSVA
ncbi:hypothetical protein ACLBYG_22310 [Methylobacterium sp. D53M]